MQANQDPQPQKLKVVPPPKPTVEEQPAAPETPTRKHSHTLIMVGTIVAAVAGISVIIPWPNSVYSDLVTTEPSKGQVSTISLPLGNYLEKITSDPEVSQGTVIAVTRNLSQEDNLRRMRQEISDTEQTLQIAKTEEDIARSKLNHAQANRPLGSGGVEAAAREIEVKNAELESAKLQLASEEANMAKFERLIEQGALGELNSQVTTGRAKILELRGKINSLNAQIAQVESRVSDLQSEYKTNVATKEAAVIVASQELIQAQRKTGELHKKLLTLRRGARQIEESQKQQTEHRTTTNGQCDLRDAKKYEGQVLPRSLEVVCYNPMAMEVKALVSQFDYKRIREDSAQKPVAITIDGYAPLSGKVSRDDVQSQPDPSNPGKFLIPVRITISNQHMPLPKDLSGRVTIELESTQLYKSIGSELVKLFPVLSHWFGGSPRAN